MGIPYLNWGKQQAPRLPNCVAIGHVFAGNQRDSMAPFAPFKKLKRAGVPPCFSKYAPKTGK